MKVRFFSLDRFRFLLFQRYWHRTGGMLGFAVVLGVLGGVTAAIFKISLDHLQNLLLNRFAGFPLHTAAAMLPRYLFFLVPAVGGLLCGLLVYNFAPNAAGVGTDALIDAFHNRGGKITLRDAIVKFVASLLTIGSGGSSGYEGPIAQVGGGLGSTIGTLLGLPDRHRRILLLTGTAAGLGAIFHAPLGGALTAAEIVYKEDFESEGFLPFVVASVIAFSCFSLITHQTKPSLPLSVYPFTHVAELFNYALLGLICVPVSWAYVKSYRGIRTYFTNLKIKAYYKPALGGLAVGLISYLCPQAVGNNYECLRQAVTGSIGFGLLLFIVVAKIGTTSFTMGSGGSGGLFGPSLFIGGILGGAVGFGLHALDPALVANPGSYVLVGMGAFFAGAAKAPLAGLIMVCEITGNYGLLPPLLIATTIHIPLARNWSIYDGQRQNKFSSPVHEHALRVDVLKRVVVREIMQPRGEIVVLPADAKSNEAYAKARYAEQDVFPVMGKEGQIAGLVSMASLHLTATESAAQDLILVGDLMTEAFTLNPDMDLHQALSLFLKSGATQLPVVTAGEIVGMIRLHDIMAAYDRRTQGVARAA